MLSKCKSYSSPFFPQIYNIWSEILEILLKNLPEPFHIDTSQSNPTQALKDDSIANHYLTICD